MTIIQDNIPGNEKTHQQIVKTLLRGYEAEKTACKFLQQQRLTLIEKNYRCRSGEIDLIMKDND